MRKFLHISDLHFTQDSAANNFTDPDHIYRESILKDVRNFQDIDGVFMTGDIASTGSCSEYDKAHQWIERLVKNTKCSRTDIYMVPGNHDVCRPVLKNAYFLKNILLESDSKKREDMFMRGVRDEELYGQLHLHLKSYNEFAAEYGCKPSFNKIGWEKRISLARGVDLNVIGINSSLMCGLEQNPRVYIEKQVYVSPFQYISSSEENVVNLVLCHHPPRWAFDEFEFDQYLRKHVEIQLFGHIHSDHMIREVSFVRMIAGAATPNRFRPPFQPCYNIITLNPVEVEGVSCFDINIKIMNLDKDGGFSPRYFRNSLTHKREDVARHRIEVLNAAHPFVDEEKSSRSRSAILFDENNKNLINVLDDGFQGVNIPVGWANEGYVCRALFIDVCEHLMSESMRTFLRNTNGVALLLFTKDKLIRKARTFAVGYENDIARYLGNCSNHSKEFLKKYTARKKFYFRIYKRFPFGLYFEVNDSIWFAPLWNTTSPRTAAYQTVLQVGSKSQLGRQLQKNFLEIWKDIHTSKYTHSDDKMRK